MNPFEAVRWGDFCQMWVNLSYALRGFPMLMPGYCDECGLRDCFDPGCQRVREGIFDDNA